MKTDENDEARIRKIKERKLAKHFDVLINKKKVKVLNYKIKQHSDWQGDGEMIEFISKLKLDKAERGEEIVTIEISTEKENITIKGVRSYTHGIVPKIMELLIG